MQYNSYSFFPVQVHHVKSNLQLTEESEYIRSLKTTFNYGKPFGGFQGSIDINADELSNIKNLIDESIANIYNKDYQILEIWGSILGDGDYNKIHNHPARNPHYDNSDIKIGIVYLDTIEASVLEVHSPANPTNTATINVDMGDLIFADAYMLHSVPPHSGQKERICIAFNFITK